MPSKTSIIVVGCLLSLILFAKFVVFTPNYGVTETHLHSVDNNWIYVPKRHANRHTLSRTECSAAFPGLYDNIEIGVTHRLGRPLAYEDVKIAPGRCMVQALIFDGELYITDLGDHLECYVSNGRERMIATLSLIHRALVSAPESVPNVEVSISYDDLPTRSTPGVTWGFARRKNEGNVWLMPDYGYWSWYAIGIPSFKAMSRSIAEVNAAVPWKQKTSQAVWRGTPHYAPELRNKLIDVTRGKPWADVKTVEIGKDEEHFLSLDGHCRYQYVVQTEGTSYSGRFKFLQLCNSVVVSHRLEYAEFATHLMHADGPKQNFVQVERDWSDLEEKMDYFTSHPDEAEAIALRSHQIFADRYLTPAAISCYLRRMIEGWSNIQGFEPTLYDYNSTTKSASLRGIPFEAFVDSFPQEKPGEYGRFAQGP